MKALVAFALVLVVSPFAGSMAFAAGSDGQQSSGATGVNAADSSTAVADPSTIFDWINLIEQDTKSVGRIWTDKTVSTDDMKADDITVEKRGDNATFLTALTALSSTSNLMSTATAPLDIVLVLDTSSSMDDPITTGGIKKIEALQNAADDFVDAIAEQNKDVSDAAKQHKVAVVSYNSSASVDQKMTVCTESTATGIKDSIDKLKTSKGTCSDLGLQEAQNVLDGSKREGAKQVVVFFTDGTPTTSGSFMPSIASPAVTCAKAMKDGGATVYTIGVLDGADPTADPTATGTSNENKFLHAVSSNYPTATYTGSGSSYAWAFGVRAEDSNFYKSATNADELENIFKEISEEIAKSAGYPTETKDGYESTSGYITFNDQLGDYMQVTDLSTLVYDRVAYYCISKSTAGNVDTYHFSGEVRSGIENGYLEDIVVTVERSSDVATGDLVQVQIPASLIPLRHFNVNLTDNKMSVTENKPIAVFYSSGLKPEAADLLANPDEAMAKYIEDNTGEDGRVNFYANKWTGNEHLGDTTSQFNPSKGNSYYYFTQDTPIYTDSDFTTRATSIVGGETYWYKHTYYVNEGGAPALKTEKVEFPGSEAAKFVGAIGTDEDGCFFKTGTARLVYINNLEKEKVKNETGTAADVLNPKWNDVTNVSAATTVTPHLGNNGKLSVEKPATLEVAKTVQVAEGYDSSKYADTSFEFTINMKDAGGKAVSGKALKAEVLAADGTRVGDEFTLTLDDDGNATHSIKDGETLKVYGLNAGWTYEISEASLPSGFAQTAPVDTDGNPAAATGAFEAGKTATASFTNKYSATGTLEGATNLKVQKNLEGRSWTEGDEFTFKIQAVTEGAPMPENDTVTVTSSDASSFGDIAYTKPGTYTYQVTEEAPETKLGGVTYSQAVYQVVVTVTDNGNGTLTATATKAQTKDDAGTEQTDELVPVETMAFTNTYSASYDYGANGGLQVSKTLTGRDMAAGEFAFTITGVDDASKALLSDADLNFTNEKAAAGVANVMKKLANVKFTQADDGKVFTFTVAEVVPADAQKLSGVTYDTARHDVKITVADNHDGTLNVATTVDGTPGNTVAFTNKYTGPATYDTATAGLKKVLEGRDWKEREYFTFSISAQDGAPLPQIDGKEVEVAMVTKASAENFSFGTITFTPEMLDGATSKTFTYTVKELEQGGSGVTADTHTATIKVTVTDNGEGRLTATAQVDGAKFTNTYKAETKEPVSISANKVLTGRDLAAGEFSFGVKYSKDYAAKTGDDLFSATNEGNGNISFGSFKYSTDSLAQLVEKGYAAKDGNAWTVNYVAYEKTDGLADKGITPTTSSVAFTVKVTDNGDGTLSAAMDSPEKITFENQYKAASAKVSLSGVKVLEHAAGLSPDSIAGKFTFTLSSDDANAPLPEKVTATNDANGNIAFDEIEFTAEDLDKALGKGETSPLSDELDQGGKETTGQGVDDSAAAKTSGIEEANQPAVNNAEAASADKADSAQKKEAAQNNNDATGNAGKQLASEPASQNAGCTETNSVGADTAKAVSDADSQDATVVTLGATPAYADELVPASEARSYTFVYKVAESGSVPGVTNDTSVKTISVKVTDDGQGKLTAEVVGSPFTFTNHYSVQPITMSVTDQVAVNKNLTGRSLAEGEFSFELFDANGETVATGVNTASGAVALSPLTYTEPGEYSYTLREVNGGKTIDNVVYDSATYAVVVKVADNGDGTLKAQSQIGGSLDGLTFSNTYLEPEPEPTPEVVPNEPTGGEKVVTTTTTTTVKSAKTGDNAGYIAVVAVVVAIAAGAFALLAKRNRR